MKKYSIIIAFIFAVTHSFAQKKLINSIDNYLELAEQYGFDGQVLIEKNGELIINKSLGYANNYSNKKITENTLFGIASLSKQFTAVAIALLAQNGKLNFDDTLPMFFENVPLDKINISVHHLLTHTSGLSGGDLIGDFEPISYENMRNRILNSSLRNGVGQKWSYSNAGYNLLALIIEKVSGVTYEQYLTEKIFNKYGLNQTKVIGYNPSESEYLIANSYRGFDDKGNFTFWRKNIRTLGSGNIASTVSDLYKWYKNLKISKILNDDYTKRLFHPHVRIHGNEYYAYGWFVFKDDNNNIRVIEHGGDYEKGYNGVIYSWKEENTLIIILSNKYEDIGANLSLRWALFYNLKDLIRGKKIDSFRKNELNEENNSLIVGRYVSKRNSSTVEIVEHKDNTLLLKFDGIDISNEIFKIQDSIKKFSLQGISKTKDLVENLIGGNLEKYKDFIEVPKNWNLFDKEWQSIEAVYGRVMSYKIVACVPNYYNDGLKCYVEFVHERGTSYMAYAWMNYGSDKLYATYPYNDVDLGIIVSKRKNALVSYNLFKNNWLEFEYDTNNNKIIIGPVELFKLEN